MTESYKPPRRSSNVSLNTSTAQSASQFTPEKDVSSGQSMARLRCQVKRDDVKVNWLRDEVEIKEDARPDKYRILEDGRERILLVKDVHNDDAGEYVCQSGKYRVTLYLNINEEGPAGELHRASSMSANADSGSEVRPILFQA